MPTGRARRARRPPSRPRSPRRRRSRWRARGRRRRSPGRAGARRTRARPARGRRGAPSARRGGSSLRRGAPRRARREGAAEVEEAADDERRDRACARASPTGTRHPCARSRRRRRGTTRGRAPARSASPRLWIVKTTSAAATSRTAPCRVPASSVAPAHTRRAHRFTARAPPTTRTGPRRRHRRSPATVPSATTSPSSSRSRGATTHSARTAPSSETTSPSVRDAHRTCERASARSLRRGRTPGRSSR